MVPPTKRWGEETVIFSWPLNSEILQRELTREEALLFHVSCLCLQRIPEHSFQLPSVGAVCTGPSRGHLVTLLSPPPARCACEGSGSLLTVSPSPYRSPSPHLAWLFLIQPLVAFSAPMSITLACCPCGSLGSWRPA